MTAANTDPGHGVVVAVGARSADFEKVVTLIAEEFARALDTPSVDAPDWWTSDTADAANPNGAEDSVRELVSAKVMVIDLDHHPVVAGYVLGARLALTEKHTFAVRRNTASGAVPWPTELEPIEIDPSSDEASIRGAVRARLRSEGKAPLATFQNGFRTSSVVDVQLKRRACHPSGEPVTRLNRTMKTARTIETWTTPLSDRAVVQLTFGGIERVKGFDCWANSENVDMQMARIVDKSVSARIRQLGSVWYGEQTSDRGEDAMFMELTRRMGARSRLKAGEVIITPVHKLSELSQELGVKAVAHVATVEPAGPGDGYRVAGSLKACVGNLMAEAAAHRLEGGKRITSLLAPLFASGDAGLPALVAASEMVAGLDAWFRLIQNDVKRRGAIERVCFVAREEDTAADIKAALGMWGFTYLKSETVPV